MSIDNTDFEGPVTITDLGANEPTAALLPRGTAVSRYIVADLIGQGGMGVVYKAFDPELNRPVALKLLSVPRSGPKAGEGQRSAEQSSQDHTIHKTRLLREAQALAQLSHPNVVTVFDVGTHLDAVFMAMEYVEGKNLKDVLEAHSQDRRALLEILKAAGQGLVAAHKVGIVHRDFKPGNVIIGNDGRVRVIDFGLARGASGEEPERSPLEPEPPPDHPRPPGYETPHSLLTSSLTQAGAIVGTPIYMAPEQHFSEITDAKSDQYSFCVVLFEALYGQRPFLGRSLREMLHRMTQEQIERPPGQDVPAWLDRITARGLAADPAARYPSMDELLAELACDPALARAQRRARRLRWAGAALVLGFAVLAAWGVWFGTTQGTRRCQASQDAARLGGIWDDASREKIRAAFEKTGRSYAADTFERVARLLSAYTRQWVAARRQACEATHVTGEQSAQLLDLRMRCLEDRLGAVRALGEVFARQADTQVVDRAVQAVSGLESIASCADTKVLLSKVARRRDGATRARVDALRSQLVTAKALQRAGKYQAALDQGNPLVAAARETGYLPVLAEVQLVVGNLLEQVAAYDDAGHLLREAVWSADMAGCDDVRLDANNDLAFLLGYRLNRFAEAEPFIRSAEAILVRTGEQGGQKARLMNCLGLIYWLKGESERALGYYQSALALREKAEGPNTPDVATVQNNIGNLLGSRGELQQALAPFTRALQIREQVFGPGHPAVAEVLNNLGNVYLGVDLIDQALEHYQRSLVIWEQTLSYDHPNLVSANNNLGLVLSQKKDYDRALAHYQRALKIGESAVGLDHPLVAETRTGLGMIALERRQYPEAIAQLSRVLAICSGDHCQGPFEETMAQARYGLAKALWATAGKSPRALELARQAREFYRSLTSVAGKMTLAEIEVWLLDRGVRVE